MFVSWIAVLSVLGALHQAQGYATGAPEGACGDMIPQHHVDPQKTKFPYKVSVSKPAIRAGEKVTVTIAAGGKQNPDFKGFFVQGRVGDQPVGKFEPAPGVKLVNCGGGQQTGATHEKAQARNKIVLTWIAPPGLTGAVVFRFTVAQNGGVFWVGHESAPLTIK